MDLARLKLPNVSRLRLSSLSQVKLEPWQRWTAYALFGVLVFWIALRQTFPIDAVKERIILEAAAGGWQVSVVDVGPSGFGAIRMTGVTLESRDGLRIPIERLDAGVRLLPLLVGRRGVSFDAAVYEGRVRGVAESSSTWSRLAANVTGVDLSRSVALRKASGMDLVGTLHGTIDLRVDQKAAAQSAGNVDLEVDGAAINAGQIPIPGMGGALTVPRMGLGKVTAKGAVKEGRLVFDRLESRGDDLEATGEGLYCVLQPRLAFAPIFGKARLRIRDAFWAKPGAGAFRPIVDVALAPAKAGDGSYVFQVFGTLSQPQARMGQ